MERLLFIKIIICFLSLFIGGCSDKGEDFIDTDVVKNITIYTQDNQYCAFCDIVYFNTKYYIAFRVATNHVPLKETDNNGYIKIMSSLDGEEWNEELDIIDSEWDLRDPCFCINTDTNELSINYGLYSYSNPYPEIKNKRTVFSQIGSKLNVEEANYINLGKSSNFWLWKIYYWDNKYWGVAYHKNEYPILVSSLDGKVYDLVSEIPVEGNETALSFVDDKLLAVSRNVDNNGNAYISESRKPYVLWSSHELNQVVASPEFVRTITNKLFIAGRSKYGVSLFSYDSINKEVSEYINFFANGHYSDRGYPGMLYREGYLYTVYYACNDYINFPSIYLSRVKLH